ncbi:hypothetical protein PoB_001189100 [Plakobranchus ocellatus]|uniref:Uncharacterized protein n=1 Tax=Plakobranchus ocellatus TaxID=259542 RepID=A0AAV3YDJ1_9GAST|nr:hypothetical protein PoB_001189100 [Plakobranchus ocellatus]
MYTSLSAADGGCKSSSVPLQPSFFLYFRNIPQYYIPCWLNIIGQYQTADPSCRHNPRPSHLTGGLSGAAAAERTIRLGGRVQVI